MIIRLITSYRIIVFWAPLIAPLQLQRHLDCQNIVRIIIKSY